MEGLLHVGHLGGGVVPQQRVHGHDDAGGAEPTLGAVSLRDPLLKQRCIVGVLAPSRGDQAPLCRHGYLDRVELLGHAPDSLHGCHGDHVQRADGREAGVDGLVTGAGVKDR